MQPSRLEPIAARAKDELQSGLLQLAAAIGITAEGD
jgi:hypothetical protein